MKFGWSPRLVDKPNTKMQLSACADRTRAGRRPNRPVPTEPSQGSFGGSPRSGSRVSFSFSRSINGMKPNNSLHVFTGGGDSWNEHC